LHKIKEIKKKKREKMKIYRELVYNDKIKKKIRIKEIRFLSKFPFFAKILIFQQNKNEKGSIVHKIK